jgi:hypothetical protein
VLKSPLPGSEDLLVKILEKLGPNRLPVLIAIDGPDGVGKTSLASWLAWQLGVPTIHLDLYVVRGSDPLQWKLDDLARAITARGKRPLILEGIKLLDALHEIGRKPDFIVYVDGPGSDHHSKALTDYRARHAPQKSAQICLKGFVEPPVAPP